MNNLFDEDSSSDNDDLKQSKNDSNSKDMKDVDKDKSDELELKQTKRQKKMKPVNEDLLTSADGLNRIYSEFPEFCQFTGRGNEKQDLKRLVDAYKEWAFQLHPGMSTADLLLKCERLGSSGRVKGYMQDLRSTERQRYLNEVFPQDPKDNNNNDNNIV